LNPCLSSTSRSSNPSKMRLPMWPFHFYSPTLHSFTYGTKTRSCLNAARNLLGRELEFLIYPSGLSSLSLPAIAPPAPLLCHIVVAVSPTATQRHGSAGLDQGTLLAGPRVEIHPCVCLAIFLANLNPKISFYIPTTYSVLLFNAFAI
jgi:hypothetical protein